MIIKSEWSGSTDSYNLSGLASFAIGDSGTQIHLNSFLDFQAVCLMLDIAYSRGVTDTTAAVRRAVNRELDKVLSSVNVYSNPEGEPK